MSLFEQMSEKVKTMALLTLLKEKVYKVDYCGDYIELTVADGCTYTIGNNNEEFESWCIKNGHAIREDEPEYEYDDASAYSTTYDASGCREDEGLVLEYCLAIIKRDFQL